MFLKSQENNVQFIVEDLSNPIPISYRSSGSHESWGPPLEILRILSPNFSNDLCPSELSGKSWFMELIVELENK